MGELVCPYSPSTIISSAIYRTNPSKHVFKQLPYLGIALLSASIAGFWAYGLGVPKVVSYIVIVMAVPIVILASKNHKKRQIKA